VIFPPIGRLAHDTTDVESTCTRDMSTPVVIEADTH